MAKSAVQFKTPAPSVHGTLSARVIDIRTRRPWRPRDASSLPFLFDLALTFTLMLLGAWLFLKMRGG